MASNNPSITFRLSPLNKRALEEVAYRERVSVSDVVNSELQETIQEGLVYLQELDDRHKGTDLGDYLAKVKELNERAE